VHYFAWFEGFGGEEAAAGAFDVRFADLDVHFLFVFCFFFALFYNLDWERILEFCFTWTGLGSVFLALRCRVCLRCFAEQGKSFSPKPFHYNTPQFMLRSVYCSGGVSGFRTWDHALCQ
jgi:hypothetical protein